MMINSKEEDDSEGILYEVELNRSKAYAVGIMARVWAGAKLPESMIRDAEWIRNKMIEDGTWESA